MTSSYTESKRDTKRCPYCAEEIRAEAIKCRYCRTVLDGRPSASGALTEPWVRRREGSMIAGVCAGLAERFEISVTVIRLAFLLLFFFSGGMGLLIYVILWVIMPVADEEVPMLDEPRRYDRPPYDPIE